MYRRQVLLGASMTIGVLSGCSVQTLAGPSTKTLGESVEHRGVKVTPDAYLTAGEVTYDMEDTNHSPTEEAPTGATYLLTHLSVKHVGESERVFPKRGGTSARDDIDMFYNGEELDTPSNENIAKAFVVEGNRLPSYLHQIFNNDQMSAVYAGSASGWLISEIPAGFTPEDASIKITWGASSTIGADESNFETYEWMYTSDAEVSASNAPK